MAGRARRDVPESNSRPSVASDARQPKRPWVVLRIRQIIVSSARLDPIAPRRDPHSVTAVDQRSKERSTRANRKARVPGTSKRWHRVVGQSCLDSPAMGEPVIEVLGDDTLVVNAFGFL
jgi:hypothetical protein